MQKKFLHIAFELTRYIDALVRQINRVYSDALSAQMRPFKIKMVIGHPSASEIIIWFKFRFWLSFCVTICFKPLIYLFRLKILSRFYQPASETHETYLYYFCITFGYCELPWLLMNYYELLVYYLRLLK